LVFSLLSTTTITIEHADLREEIRSCGYEHAGVNEKDGFHDRQLKNEERDETSESDD
jgi:hypothetical protein